MRVEPAPKVMFCDAEIVPVQFMTGYTIASVWHAAKDGAAAKVPATAAAKNGISFANLIQYPCVRVDNCHPIGGLWPQSDTYNTVTARIGVDFDLFFVHFGVVLFF